MTAFLIDEMFAPSVAELLRENHGHDAAHAVDVGLQAAADEHVAALARAEARVLVTENVVDFAPERGSC